MPMASPPAPANNSTLRIQKSPNSCGQAGEVERLTLLNSHHTPADLAQGALAAAVAPRVAFNAPTQAFSALLICESVD